MMLAIQTRLAPWLAVAVALVAGCGDAPSPDAMSTTDMSRPMEFKADGDANPLSLAEHCYRGGPHRLPPTHKGAVDTPAQYKPSPPSNTPHFVDATRSSTSKSIIDGARANRYDIDAAIAANSTLDDVLMYWPDTTAESKQFATEVQEAFTLARSGALYAAERRFLETLRQIALLRDASSSSDQHGTAMKSALAALTEAEDFAGLTRSRAASTVDLSSLATAHRTPVLFGLDASAILPHEAIALYHRYAERKFAVALGGDPAASMALYGLGRVYAYLGLRDDLDNSMRQRCITMYQAAVTVRQDNPLAANELGVLLARGGRVVQAHQYLNNAVQLAPSANHLHNLAVVTAQLGNSEAAAELESQAQLAARHELANGQLAKRQGVQWVSPSQFNRTSENMQSIGQPQTGEQNVARNDPNARSRTQPIPRWPNRIQQNPGRVAQRIAPQEPQRSNSSDIRLPGQTPALRR